MATANGCLKMTTPMSTSSCRQPQQHLCRNSNNNNNNTFVNFYLQQTERANNTISIRCCAPATTATTPTTRRKVVSSTFPSEIPIPEITFYPDEDACLPFPDNRLFFGNGTGKFYHFELRMSIGDADDSLDTKLTPLWDAYHSWHINPNFFQKIKRSSSLAHYLLTTISGYLLDHVDSWICGYSFVSYSHYDLKFDGELQKLESVFSRYARGKKSSDAPSINSVELFLQVDAYGTICDRDIHNCDELIELLQQLKTLDSVKERILQVTPLFYPYTLSEEKLARNKGYAHMCLGKFD